MTGPPAAGEIARQLTVRARAAVRRRWPQAELSDLEPLHGGISSLTFTATLTGAGDTGGRGDETAAGTRRDGRRVVVKAAPPGLAPVRNRDVLRQARVLRGLHSAPGVRVPEVLAQDAGDPPLFVMEFVPGESHEPKWDVSPAPPAPEVVRARARAAARMLARLQAVEPAAAGLAAEPALSPAQELERWTRLFATAGEDLRGDEQPLAEALVARVPPAAPAARVLHGDYRLGNMQFAGERLAAIIDWEIWSVGDPRHDLAWLMAFADPVMQRASARDAANEAAAEAMPSPDELLAEYLDAAGVEAPPPQLGWFMAMAYYKLGATMAVLAKRNRRLAEPDPSLELAAQTTPPMLARARELLA